MPLAELRPTSVFFPCNCCLSLVPRPCLVFLPFVNGLLIGLGPALLSLAMAAITLSSLYSTLRASVFLAPWLLHLALADLCLSAFLPLSAFAPSLTYHLSSSIAASVWLGIQKIFTSVNGARISLSGASLPPAESAIVVANHLSWADFYMIQQLALNAGMLGRCRWFAKQQLKWVPFLGWGLWAMGMPLVSRNWIRDRAEIQRIFGNVVGRRWPVCKSSFRFSAGDVGCHFQILMLSLRAYFL